MSNQLTARDGQQIILRAIVAMDRKGAIGYENDLIFKNPKDLEFFKKKTTGHICVMGRLTFESIGRILPKRQTVILTRSAEEYAEKIKSMKLPADTPRPIVSNDSIQGIMDAVESYGDHNVYVCGGAAIYGTYKRYVNTWIVTQYNVFVEEEAGLLPPNYDPEKIVRIDTGFKRLMSTIMESDTWNGITYRIFAYMRSTVRSKQSMTMTEIEEMNREASYYEYKNDRFGKPKGRWE